MARKSKYATTIQGKFFPTKKALGECVRGILKRGRGLTREEETFMLEFFERHPRWEQKSRGGVTTVFVGPSPESPEGCFWLQRTDGSCVDISYNKCLTPSGYVGKRARSSLRTAVSGQMMAFKREALAGAQSFVCPLNGEVVTGSDIHVDHVAPATFAALVRLWMEREGFANLAALPVEDDPLRETRGPRLRPDVAQSWQAFHAEHAVLRLLSARANMGEARQTARGA